MPVRTGIYGGSFNPVHIGHLALANYLCEYGGLDEVWFMVSPQNPLKRNCRMADDYLRLRMVQSAIAGYSRFRASDFEFGLPRPSYMVDTLSKLAGTYPDREFVLIIGSDNWATFPQWKAPEEILARHSVLIYPRPGYKISPNSLPPHVETVQTPLLEISSTFIRSAIGQGKDVRYFLHPEVWKLIQDNKLYQTE